jgi:excisionase family DNA binding protein
MTARRASWPLVGPAVVIDAVTAPAVLALLADGRRRAAREQWRLADETVDILDSLDALANHARKQTPPPPEGEPDWITTDEAAARLGVTARQVRRMAERNVLRSKRLAGRLFVDAADALSEADARADVRTRGDVCGVRDSAA